MKKFEFKQTGIDTFELIKLSTNEAIPFKRTIEVGKTIQYMDVDARYEMIKYMQDRDIKRDGMIKKVVNDKDGTVTYDETYLKDFERQFIESAQTRMLNNVHTIAYGKNLFEILIWLDIIEDQDNAMIYGVKFREILMGANVGEIPSGTNEQLPTEVIAIEQDNI